MAYTTSSLHLEMLRIFCDVRCRLPNVVVGFITRASVRRAMASGMHVTYLHALGPLRSMTTHPLVITFITPSTYTSPPHSA